MPKAILELEMPENCWDCPLVQGRELSPTTWCGYSGKDCPAPAYQSRRSDCPLKLADEHLLKALSVDAGKDYHNPADVEVLKQARGALCDALDEVTYSRE